MKNKKINKLIVASYSAVAAIAVSSMLLAFKAPPENLSTPNILVHQVCGPIANVAFQVKEKPATLNTMDKESEPEDYPPENEEELINQALLARSVRIDNCKITHYCAEDYPHICGNGDGLTAMGTRIMPYITCAVDPDVIPLGATVMVDYGDGELHFYVAEDTGCMKGAHIDLCVESHQEALDLGVKRATVYWCEERIN